MKPSFSTAILFAFALLAVGLAAQRGGGGGAPPAASTPTPPGPPRVEALKKEAAAEVEALRVQTQQMVDQVFSFGELGFQEFETSKYLTNVLEKNGFKVERGYAGVPTAWFGSKRNHGTRGHDGSVNSATALAPAPARE
jgi:aminobenzoyl-glutamate utilization protein B